MEKVKREKFGLIWKFIFGKDIIVYKRIIESTDLESAIDYAIMWVEKFGYNYGRCIHCDVVVSACDVATIYFKEVNGRNIVNFIA